MRSKTLVLVVFALWSILCWYRYVCGIKQVCTDRPALAQQAIPFEPEILDEPLTGQNNGAQAESPTQTIQQTSPTTAPPPSTTPSQAAPDINKSQVEELADHVRIHFPYNSTQKVKDPTIDAYLSRLAQQLIAQGGTVTLTGHTDNVGDSKTNDAFAMRRAKNIRDILIEKGVPRKQIICKSSGERKPIATNDNPQGRYKNRRVEVHVRQ